jgi:signal transduction histidine kinase
MKLFCGLLMTISVSVHAQLFDFSGHNFETDGPRSLRGDWAFYWDTLFIPSDPLQVSKIVKMPHFWEEGNPNLFGNATYHARLKLPIDQTQLAIYIPFIRCAGRVFVDGKLAGALGKVGGKNDYHSMLGSLMITLPNTHEVDLVIQVSNYEYRGGGLSSNIRIGKASELLHSIQIKQGLDLFFAGSLIAMAIYLVTMYYLYRQGYSFLLLALICVAVVLRSVTTESSSLFLPNLFPGIGWDPWKKIEFFSVYAIVALFPLYVSQVFPAESIKKINYAFVALATILCFIVVFTHHYIFDAVLDVAHVGLLAGFIYATYVIIKALRKKNPDARILLLGLFVAFPFILLEILKNSALQIALPFTHLVEFGVLSFLLFQVYVLANHNAMTYQGMELQVKLRTAELTQSNEINNRMLAVLSHDVKGPVNALKAIMHMFNQGNLTESELKPLAVQIEAQAGSISLLIENVLLWVKTQISGVEVSWETFILADWVNPHLELYTIQAKGRNITLTSKILSDVKVKSDRQVISLVIRNLISNAIKFAYEGTTVTIAAQASEDVIRLTVSNQGIGMTPEQVQAVFQNTKSLKSVESTSLGLKLCRTYLQAIGSDFEIISSPNQQTFISIILKKAN